MRGRRDAQSQLSYLIDVESRIRSDHPLRALKRAVDGILQGRDALFSQAYSRCGRPSVPPERLLKALLLMALYSIRSERQLCERIDTDLLFRWFLDLSPDDAVFDATAFTHHRPRSTCSTAIGASLVTGRRGWAPTQATVGEGS